MINVAARAASGAYENMLEAYRKCSLFPAFYSKLEDESQNWARKQALQNTLNQTLKLRSLLVWIL